MALRIQVCKPHPMSTTGSVSQSSGVGWSTKQIVASVTRDRAAAAMITTGKSKRVVSLIVKSNLDTNAAATDTVEPVVAVVGQVTEVNNDTFWPIVKSAGDKMVVLDMYTQWCGPCKIIAPKYQLLSEKYLDTVFLKLDCNQENKPLATELGIKVVPTFKILKDGKIVKEITGAKYDDLVHAIESVRSSQ